MANSHEVIALGAENLARKFEKIAKNPIELAWTGLRILDRRDRLGQISYVNKQLKTDFSNLRDDNPSGAEYAIRVRPTRYGKGTIRNVCYFKEIDGNPHTRQVAIVNYDTDEGPGDAEKLAVIDTPQTPDGSKRTVIYLRSEGLSAESEFPFSEVCQELTGIFKQFRRTEQGGGQNTGTPTS